MITAYAGQYTVAHRPVICSAVLLFVPFLNFPTIQCMHAIALDYKDHAADDINSWRLHVRKLAVGLNCCK